MIRSHLKVKSGVLHEAQGRQLVLSAYVGVCLFGKQPKKGIALGDGKQIVTPSKLAHSYSNCRDNIQTLLAVLLARINHGITPLIADSFTLMDGPITSISVIQRNLKAVRSSWGYYVHSENLINIVHLHISNYGSQHYQQLQRRTIRKAGRITQRRGAHTTQHTTAGWRVLYMSRGDALGF